MKKFLFVLVFALFVNVSFVNAEACDNNDISRLKVLASDVEFTYEYNYDLVINDYKIYNTYTLYINNITDELYIKESKTNTDYSGYVIDNGTIKIDMLDSGKKSFKIYSRACNRVLRTKYLDLPNFNLYSEYEECGKYSDLDICGEFYDTSNITEAEFYNKIYQYVHPNDDDGDSDNVISSIFHNKLTYIIIGGIILIGGIIALVIYIRKRREVLE